MNILFVCSGNDCRSPMAELITTDILSRYGMKDRISAKSAGTNAAAGAQISEETARFLRKKGLDTSKFRSKQLKKEDYWKYDKILCMDRFDVWNAIKIFGTDIDGKVDFLLKPVEAECGLEVKDTSAGGNVEEAYELILKACRSIILSALL